MPGFGFHLCLVGVFVRFFVRRRLGRGRSRCRRLRLSASFRSRRGRGGRNGRLLLRNHHQDRFFPGTTGKNRKGGKQKEQDRETEKWRHALLTESSGAATGCSPVVVSLRGKRK